MGTPVQASIIIPSLGRGESLARCLESLKQQSYPHWEVVLVTERGELAALRNQGARKAAGEILCFIDDDVLLPKGWLEGIVHTFAEDPKRVGVSGPAVIPASHLHNRDIFRYPFIKGVYDTLFLGDRSHLPGHITEAGAWTTGAHKEDCSYEGEVEFLEACNQAWQKEAFWSVGGYDEEYKGVGDWSEPDLAYRITHLNMDGTGWMLREDRRLWFTPRAKLYHLPSRSGAFGRRREGTASRLRNYYRFAGKWVRPHWRHTLYKGFLWGYYTFRGGK